MPELKHQFVTTNGIRMHYVEQGSGPLVVLCHGWPESWYSYRRQIPALAAAGYRVVAPDQRGYGQTESPQPIESYNILNLSGDIVGLVNGLGAESAVIVGHDWGAPVAWHCALLRPDIFGAIALLSVPYFPRGRNRPTEAMKALAGDNNFYQLYFQEPGRVEKELDADPRRSMAMALYSASGDAKPDEAFKFVFPKNTRFIDAGALPKKLPPWLTEADLDFFAGEFKRAGFRGGVNWYRNSDRNWELTPFLDAAKLRQPAVFAAGEIDPVGSMMPGGYENAGMFTPNLRKKLIIQGAGHWIQQERPKEINELLIEFLKSVG
jgi:pimeloyl-ACP methyl ester carboxylesterase